MITWNLSIGIPREIHKPHIRVLTRLGTHTVRRHVELRSLCDVSTLFNLLFL